MNSALTEALTAIRSRLSQAKPGPWFVSLCNTGESCWCRCVGNKEGSDRLEDCIIPSGSVSKNDAELIAHAPTDIAKLLRAVELLREQRDAGTRLLHANGWIADTNIITADEDAAVAKLFEEGE